MRITDEHWDHYLEHGFTLVEGFIGDDALAEIREAIEQRVPGFFEYASNPENEHPPVPKDGGFGEPPFAPVGVDVLDRVVFDQEIREFAARYIGTDNLLMEGGILQLKHYRPDQDDQDLHWDYGNHTLTYPPAARSYAHVANIVYYTDVTVDTAPTYVVSQRHYPNELAWPNMVSKDQRPDLYEHEQPVEASAGSLLIYGMRTYHRGSAFRRPGARAAQFFTYCSAGYAWMGITGHAGRAQTPQMRAFIQQATVDARTAMGFPHLGTPTGPRRLSPRSLLATRRWT